MERDTRIANRPRVGQRECGIEHDGSAWISTQHMRLPVPVDLDFHLLATGVPLELDATVHEPLSSCVETPFQVDVLRPLAPPLVVAV